MRIRTSTPRRSTRAVVAAVVLSVMSGLLLPFASVPAAQAVEGPEPQVGAPYAHWTVRDAAGALVAGATFELQGPRNGGSNNWNAAVTIDDRVAAGCTGPDTDPDAGEFQVTNIGQHRISNTSQYRLRHVSNPSGSFAPTTSWDTTTSGGWASRSFDFGTYAAVSRALSCVANTFYALSSDGAVVRVAGGAISGLGSWSNVNDSANAIGMSAGGGVTYALVRSGTNASNVTSILRYTEADGFETLPGTAYTTTGSAALVAGAVERGTGRYYFGGFQSISSSTLQFRLHSYAPTEGFRFVGSFSTSNTNANGDMAFDAAGNLVVVQSDASASTSSSITASALAAARGGTIPVTVVNGAGNGLGDVNGIAFDTDGSIVMANASSARRYQPSNFAVVGGTITSGLGGSSSDLASCVEPVTVSVQKDVAGRVTPTDQFRLSLRQGAGGATLATATTTGTATGVQAARITDITVPTSETVTISESMASGTAANYEASWACVSGTQVIASGTGTSGTFTTPAMGGASVVCTFTNAPLVTSITVRKDMQDVNGANTAPRERWTVGAAVASGATQIGTVTTSTQQTAANGTASWTIRHTNASTAARIAISEQQQAGFDFVQAYCDVTPLGGTPARTAITSAAGSTLTIAPGSTVSCVFTNKVRPTTLTLVKQVTFGAAQTSLFTLTATAPSGALAGPTGVSGAAATTSARITPAVAYRLSESGGPATYAQVGSWTCVNQAGATVAVSAAGDVSAAQGDDVTCTVRNATANLVILERIEGTTSLTANQFSLTSTPTALAGLEATTVTGSESVASGSTIQVRPGHGYALTSTSTAASIGLRFERYTGTVGANGSVDHTNAALWVAADPATVSVAAGQTGIYRFVATAPNPFVLPTTGGVGTAQIQLLGGGFAALALLTGLGLLLHRRRPAA